MLCFCFTIMMHTSFYATQQKTIKLFNLETEWAMPPVHFFLPNFLHYLRSQNPLPLFRNAELLRYFEAAFALVLQEAHC
jgi:hypothetical protein